MGHSEKPIDPGAALDRKRRLQQAITSERRAALVVNTRSRHGQRLFERAQQLLVERGLVLDAAYAVRDPARLPEIVLEAVERGHKYIIVGGGDGSISSVVDSFAHRDVVLGLLPVGTANSFARAVGVPLDISEAIDVLATGKVADVDIGRINENFFANAAAIGLPASIARDMPHAMKRWLGRVGYLMVAVKRLAQHRPFHCTVTANGRRYVFDALEVRIANGQYQGGVRVAEEANVESRDLVLQAIKGRSRSSIAKFWWNAVRGRDTNADDVDVIRATDLTLETEPPQYVSIDGEPVTQTPLRARVARQALLLMVPHDSAEIY